MNSPHRPHPMALASEWIGRIFTVVLEMVVPLLLGVKLDEWLDVKYFMVVGLVLGFVLGMSHLLLMTRSMGKSTKKETKKEIDSKDQL